MLLFLFLNYSHLTECEVVTHCGFDLYWIFSWWLMMLNIFSCACWPFVNFLWKSAYANKSFAHILIGLFVYCFYCWVLYILDISPLYIMIYKCFLLFCKLFFYVLDDVLWHANVLILMKTCLFFSFCNLCFWCCI